MSCKGWRVRGRTHLRCRAWRRGGQTTEAHRGLTLHDSSPKQIPRLIGDEVNIVLSEVRGSHCSQSPKALEFVSHGSPYAEPPSMRWAARKSGDTCHPTLAVPLAEGEAGQQKNSRENKSSQTQVVRGEGQANSCVSKAV